MRILLAGTPDVAIPIFEAVAKSSIDIAGVITNPPKSKGRSGKPIPSSVSQWALQRSLPLFERGDIEEFRSELAKIDLVLVVAYGRLIPRELLDLPRFGWLNVHFSLLPEARGAAPVQRLIASGAHEIGFTLFRLDEGMDTGPIYYQSEAIKISEMTSGQVLAELSALTAGRIVTLLEEVLSGKKPVVQAQYHGLIPFAPKISSEEARINWSLTNREILQRIRAFNPAPSAWTYFRGERFIIHSAHHVEELSDGHQEAGKIIATGKQVIVVTGSGSLSLDEVQPFGKRRMSALDWARGVAFTGNEAFE